MSNRKTLKFNNHVLKQFNNANIDTFMGVAVSGGYVPPEPTPSGYTITVSNVSNQSGVLSDNATYIKFDTAPTDANDYDYNSVSGVKVAQTFENKQVAYVWGYSYTENGTEISLITNHSSYSSALQITFTQDTSLSVIYYTHHDDSCLAENTLILLADGTTKLIQDIGYDDLLLTYDPYLKAFTSQYPALITGPLEHFGKRKINFANGCYLELTDDHSIYNLRTQTFQTIPEVSTDNFYGAYYDETIGDFVSSKITSVEIISGPVNAYNVFTPMCGSIIANGMWVSGNFLSFEPVELLLKKPNTKDWDTDLLDSNINSEKEEDIVQAYLDFNSQLNAYGVTIPIQVYMGSVRRYIPMMKKMFPEFARMIGEGQFLVDQTVTILTTCLSNIKPLPEYCKIILDGQVIANIKTEESFTFPDTYDEYLDLSDYKTYRPGDTKTIYVSTVIYGKEAN